MFYVYALFSEKFDRLYIGQTRYIGYRLMSHNSGLVRSTKAYIPWRLVYVEMHPTRGDAMKREKELKSFRGREYIRSKMDQW